MSVQDCQSNIPAPSDEHLIERVRQLEDEIKQARAAKQQRGRSNKTPGFASASTALQEFIKSNVLPIHISDVDGHLYEVNDATVDLLGYSKEEFESGKVSWRQITPPEYAHLDDDAVEQIKLTGKATSWEKEYFHKDGHRVPVLIGVNALDKTGRFCVAYLVDLSEKKKIEAETKASEAKFKLLAEAIPQIVWITNSNGRRKYCNQRFYDFTGIKREEDDGLLWLSVIHPDERDEYFSDAQKAAKHHSVFEREARWRRADGTYRWQLVRGMPNFDAKTQAYIWFGTCTDIDDQRRAAEDLKESEARYATLADAIPQIVFTANAAGRIDFCNHRWFEFTGLTEEQSRNDAWHLLIHPDDLPRYIKEWKHALETGDSYEFEFRLKRAIGPLSDAKRYRWHLARAVALRGRDGEVLKWFATWTEIERQRRNRR